MPTETDPSPPPPPPQIISLNAPSFVELSDFYKYYHHSYALDGVMLLFCTLKFFKFFRLNFRLNAIPLTLQYAFPLLVAFCILFLTVFIGFQIFAMQTFGAELRNYASTFLTMRTLLSMLLGKLNYTELEEVHGAFAPMFIFTYMLVMYFVVVSWPQPSCAPGGNCSDRRARALLRVLLTGCGVSLPPLPPPLPPCVEDYCLTCTCTTDEHLPRHHQRRLRLDQGRAGSSRRAGDKGECKYGLVVCPCSLLRTPYSLLARFLTCYLLPTSHLPTSLPSTIPSHPNPPAAHVASPRVHPRARLLQEGGICTDHSWVKKNNQICANPALLCCQSLLLLWTFPSKVSDD